MKIHVILSILCALGTSLAGPDTSPTSQKNAPAPTSKTVKQGAEVQYKLGDDPKPPSNKGPSPIADKFSMVPWTVPTAIPTSASKTQTHPAKTTPATLQPTSHKAKATSHKATSHKAKATSHKKKPTSHKKKPTSGKKKPATHRKKPAALKKTGPATKHKATKRHDAFRSDANSEAFTWEDPTNNTSSPSLAPVRRHGRDWTAVKRAPDPTYVFEGYTKSAGTKDNLATFKLIQCLAVLVLDKDGKKVMAHFSPFTNTIYPNPTQQYNNFKAQVDKLGSTDLRFYFNVPSQSMLGNAVIADIIGKIDNEWHSFDAQNNRAWMVNRLPPIQKATAYDASKKKYVRGQIYSLGSLTVEGRSINKGGIWYEAMENAETGERYPEVLTNIGKDLYAGDWKKIW